MKFVEFHESREVLKLVKFDEVFVKLKEIVNPRHHDFVQVWVAPPG